MGSIFVSKVSIQKSKRMKQSIFAVMALVLISCGTKKNDKSVDKTETPLEMERDKVIVASVKTGEFAKENDPFTIDTAYMEGNKLIVKAHFGGGCADHNFELIGSPAIAKSYPAIRAIQLVHHSNQDRCKAILRKTIEADVATLTDSQREGHVIYYQLEGYKPRIEHTFKTPEKPKK